MKKIIFLYACLIVTPLPLIAEIHRSVQSALDYEIPANTCTKPKKFANTTSSKDSHLISSGSLRLAGGGSANISDMDSYTINRLNRKERKWKKCVSHYKAALFVDMNRLKSSAQYGLTQLQANIIMGKMRKIQNIYLSPDGTNELAKEGDSIEKKRQ